MRFSALLLAVASLLASPERVFAAGDQSPGSSGNVQSIGMTNAEVRKRLESEGYTNVHITNNDKHHIDVTATKNGKPQDLAVNPHSGLVMPDPGDEN